ncbi:MAG: hypothetical protein ABIE94_01060 [archaeon]
MDFDPEEWLEEQKQRLLQKYDCETIQEVTEKLEKILEEQEQQRK